MSEESHYAKVQAHALATSVGVQMEQMSWTFASLASVDPRDVDSATDGSVASLDVAQFQRFIERHHTLGAMEAVHLLPEIATAQPDRITFDEFGRYFAEEILCVSWDDVNPSGTVDPLDRDARAMGRWLDQGPPTSGKSSLALAEAEAEGGVVCCANGAPACAIA